MKILVINCGSSSLKYKLYDFASRQLICSGLIEKIGERRAAVRSHAQGIKAMIARLLGAGVIKGPEEIGAVGHRVVHGGEAFRRPCLIDKAVIKKISTYAALAPLHNPANLAGIAGCRDFFNNIPQVAVFDTAFHQTMPEYAFRYAIAPHYYKKYGIRRYGFHGTSHQFVAQQAARRMNKSLRGLKLVTCHLGNGCSIAAIDRGKSLDTSMGFTPLEGLIMGTRCGDIDAAAVFHIMEKERISFQAMNSILNRQSGLLGISGLSNDMRQIRKKASQGTKACRLALAMFWYRIKKYIGAYCFILGGADAVCFTGGIGSHSPRMIKEITGEIHKVISRKTKVLVIPTDEELMIADLTYKVAASSRKRKGRAQKKNRGG